MKEHTNSPLSTFNSQLIKVHSYESMGTFDGPGLRLVVFLQGCPFRCLYCANPDTIDPGGESKETRPAEILEMAVSQKPFFGKKGGVTFSGGEPTVQAEALIPLFRDLKAQGIHICLDSNGGVWNKHVEELLGLTDLVLLDVKQFNPERHQQLTGRSNTQTRSTSVLSGCAMYWCPAIAMPRPIYASWDKHWATTAAYSVLKYCPITAWEYTSTRPWAWTIS